MLNVRDHISPTIADQFPDLYREEGDFLVEFVKAYYEHNETIMDRNVPKLRDVDTTLASFLVFFKKKYLQSLPIDTVVDTRFIIKHIQDLYKRKGSEESLRLLFRMFFDEDIEVFYPSTAILKPSDSIWGGAEYLELRAVSSIDGYPIKRGDKLRGDVSGATAFVDDLIFVNFSGTICPIAYLSNSAGRFISDDSISVTRLGVTTSYGKLVTGSLSNVNVIRGTAVAGQEIGDIVTIESTGLDRFGNPSIGGTGTSATGVVSDISTTTTGKIDFVKENDGFGYSVINNDIDVSISTQALIVAGSTAVSSIQPGQHIVADDDLSDIPNTFGPPSGTATINGGGRVVAYNHPLLYVRSNRQDPDRRSTDASARDTKATFLSFVQTQLALAGAGDSTVDPKMLAIFNSDLDNTGYRLGDISNSGYNFVTSRYINGEDATIFANYISGSATTAQTTWIEDRLLPAVYADGFGFEFNSIPAGETVNITVGSNNSVTITTIADYNATASFRVEGISNQESVSIITDFIGNFADKPLAVIINATAMVNPGIYEIETPGTTDFTLLGSADNNVGTRFIKNTTTPIGSGTVTDVVATNYGMSGTLVSQGFNAETLNTRIKDAFEAKSITIGSIAGIVPESEGNNYVNDVFSEIEYVDVARFDSRDTILTFTNPNFLIEVGEIVTQEVQIEDPDFGNNPDANFVPGTNDQFVYYTSIGKFLKREGNDFYFQKLSFYDFDDNYPIFIKNNQYALSGVRPDSNSLAMGRNAIISGNASYETGQIEDVDITNTGYRYVDGEVVDLKNESHQLVAKAIIRTLGPGKTEGKWSSTTSFLSDNTKYLHDNDYYQEYSYEISSVIDPEKYTQLIKDTVGVAGTKVFSSPLINSTSNLDSTLDVEFQIWNLSDEPYVTEGTEENIMTEGNPSEVLVTELVSLDQTATDAVTTSIGT